MNLSQYTAIANTNHGLDHRVQQLIALARTLAEEIETLQAELSTSRTIFRHRHVDLDRGGIDFYREVEQYEIDLISAALEQAAGNQSHAARLLHMNPTTLNAKLKHYGLNPNRLVVTQRATQAGASPSS